MIVFVAVRIHHTATMPKGGSPAAPVFMGIVSVKNEPAPFHLRITQLLAAPARHLAFTQGKVHMLRRISVKVIDS